MYMLYAFFTSAVFGILTGVIGAQLNWHWSVTAVIGFVIGAVNIVMFGVAASQ